MSDALLIVTIILAVITFVLLVVWLALKRQAASDDKGPAHLKALKRNTAEFGIQYSELQFGKLLGKGSQGEVFKAMWRGGAVAVKKIDTRKVPPEIVEEFCQEADIMRRLRHPSLTLFLGVCLEQPYLCIVTEIVQRGSLFDIIHDEHNALTWPKCLSIATDVASGLVYMHAHNPPLIHRDLKSLNILVDENWKGKVADFGMTRFQEDGTMTQCGSPLWMAPEMIKNDPYDEKADVYSFGVCLWELYTRKIPYRELNLNPSHLVVRVVKESLRPPIPKGCPKKYADLMRRCWAQRAESRPTFKEILKTLEGFLQDPTMVNHRIGGETGRSPSIADASLAAAAAAAHGDTDDGESKTPRKPSTDPGLQNEGWRIADKKAVTLTGQSAEPRTARIFEDGDSKERASEDGFDTVLGQYRGKVVAIKKCYLGRELKSDDSRVWSVMKYVGQLRHPNVVLFMGAYSDGDYVGCVTERMSQGSLEGVVLDSKIQLDWDTMLAMLIDTAQGMSFLHGNQPPVIHDDFRSSRLLVADNWRVKVADVGFVNLSRSIAQKPMPPNAWCAPEVLKDPAARCVESNVYSFGIIISEMLSRKRPYEGKFGSPVAQSVVKDGLRPSIPSSAHAELRDIAVACWDADKAKRPTFPRLLEQLQKLKERGPPKISLTLGVDAHKYQKGKTVYAYRSKDPITILKDWGRNVGKAGSYIVLSGEDDVYMLDAEVFAQTYEPFGDESRHEFRKTGTVIARCMGEPFSIKTKSGALEHGVAGDFLVQDEKGDQWIIDGKTFTGLYVRVSS